MVGPSILPVVQLFIPGVVVETLGAVPFSGELRIIQDHDGTHMDLAYAGRSPSTRGRHRLAHARLSAGARTFSLEIRDGAGKAVTDGLLGLPYQGEWTLAPCWSDKTCMRNLLGFLARRRASARARRAPASWRCSSNGDYQGLYQLQAPAKQGQGRVDIPAPPRRERRGAHRGVRLPARGASANRWRARCRRSTGSRPTTAPGTWPHQIALHVRLSAWPPRSPWPSATTCAATWRRSRRR
jgi:hypothetical protein